MQIRHRAASGVATQRRERALGGATAQRATRDSETRGHRGSPRRALWRAEVPLSAAWRHCTGTVGAVYPQRREGAPETRALRPNGARGGAGSANRGVNWRKWANGVTADLLRRTRALVAASDRIRAVCRARDANSHPWRVVERPLAVHRRGGLPRHEACTQKLLVFTAHAAAALLEEHVHAQFHGAHTRLRCSPGGRTRAARGSGEPARARGCRFLACPSAAGKQSSKRVPRAGGVRLGWHERRERHGGHVRAWASGGARLAALGRRARHVAKCNSSVLSIFFFQGECSCTYVVTGPPPRPV